LAATDSGTPGWRKALNVESQSAAWVRALARDYAEERVAEFGQGDGVDVSGLDVCRLPTFWMSALIHVARIRAVLVERTSPTGNKSTNQLDLMHLEEAASYADVFVCRDRRLRTFSSHVLDLRCEVLSFEQWHERLIN
jgi:hypothetical protein